jgi:hypothetical protein
VACCLLGLHNRQSHSAPGASAASIGYAAVFIGTGKALRCLHKVNQGIP